MIYLITNMINGHQYIGKTSRSVEQRWQEHWKEAAKGNNRLLHNAIRKHGKDNFYVEFLCEGLDDEEVRMIEIHQPFYNMTKGGDGGDTSSSPAYVEGIKRRSYKGELNPNYGKRGNLSPLFGRKKTPEQIEKYRSAYKGKRIPVKVNGIDYDSVARAAKELNRSERYVRIHDELNKWTY